MDLGTPGNSLLLPPLEKLLLATMEKVFPSVPTLLVPAELESN